jgi:acyl-CoA thioesterase-2
MNPALAALLEGNQLQVLDDNLFLGRGTWGSGVRLYGGEVMSQSLSAAQHTVPDEFALHSMHAYFMRPGDPARPVIYDVEKIRDGRSILSRRVTARQHGRAIYSCQSSFQKREQGFEHQSPMPRVPGPESLKTDQALFAEQPNSFRRPSHWPVEFRQVHPLIAEGAAVPAGNQVWMKADGRLPDALAIHQQILAFASDNHLLSTALRPHGVRSFSTEIQGATIDHSLWFHRPFRIDDWLLFDLHSPTAVNSRGLNLGYIYDLAGNLVATAAQEGLIRKVN